MPHIKFTPDASDRFYAVLKQRVSTHFESTGKRRFGDRSVALKGLLFAAVAFAAYLAVLFAGLPAWGMLALASICGVFTLLLAINIAHDAAHHALTPSRPLNNLLHFLTFSLLGASAYLWQQRHVKSHHVFPNVNGCDIDIDYNPLFRLSPNQARRTMHRFQHLYAPLVYALAAVHTVFVQDFIYLFKRQLANMHDIRHPAVQYPLFLLGKTLHLGLALALPMLVLPVPWWGVVLGYLAATFAASLAFVYLLVGTHFAEETCFPEVGEGGRIEHSWVTHALVTSLDWSPRSRVACFFMGGANAHAAHHLFPTVCHCHYPAISGLIEQAAREFGMPYHKTTLPGMIASHVRFLRRMGRAPEVAAGGAPGLAPV